MQSILKCICSQKRALLSLLLLCCICIIFPRAAVARSLKQVMDSKILRVAFDGVSPGLNSFEDRKLVGFEVDLVGEITRRLQLTVEPKIQSFDTLLLSLGQDRFDLIATSFAMTPERSAAVQFTQPHYCTSSVLISRQGGPKTTQDLVGKTVVVPRGTIYGDPLKTVPGIREIRMVPDEPSGLQALITDHAQAWVTERLQAIKILKDHPEHHLQIGDALAVHKDAMVVQKGNLSLVQAINEQIQAILDDGTYKKLSFKYFNEDIRCKN